MADKVKRPQRKKKIQIPLCLFRTSLFVSSVLPTLRGFDGSTSAIQKSTLILTVNLECRRCDKKIRKVIAKCPEIQSHEFDEKNNKVKVSGPFDPEKLKRKLRCKACKYIIHIEIKPPDQPQPKPKPEPVLPVPGIPVGPYAPMVCCKPCDDHCKPCYEGCKPKPCDDGCKPCYDGCKPKPCYEGCKPCYEGYPEHGICTRFGCERGCKRFGCERGTCNIKFFSEEDPSCTIM